MIIDRSGRVDVGAWDPEVQISRSALAELQNLVPIVDRGRPAPSAAYTGSSV